MLYQSDLSFSIIFIELSYNIFIFPKLIRSFGVFQDPLE